MRSNDRVDQNNSSLSAGSCLKGNTPGCYETRPQWSRSGAAGAEAFWDSRPDLAFMIRWWLETNGRLLWRFLMLWMLTSCNRGLNIHELEKKRGGVFGERGCCGDRKFSIKAERKRCVWEEKEWERVMRNCLSRVSCSLFWFMCQTH